MNWLQKISVWQERGLDAGEHLHQAFMQMFRTTDVPRNVFEHVDSGLIYYLPGMYPNTSRGGGRVELGFESTTTFEYKNFGFVFDDCMYRLEVPLGSSLHFNQDPSMGSKMKMIDIHNLVGTLTRIFDVEVGSEYAKIGVIRGSDPLQFSTNIESVIKSDRDDNHFEETLEPEPNPGSHENSPVFAGITMNWLRKISREEPRIADPYEMGYKDEWGEHHGPVEYIPDTWNYGPKGYYSEPIPMPKKLYHATPYADLIVEQGFKLPKDLGKQTFGGGDEFMSFTSLQNALNYQAVIRDLVTVSNGGVSGMDVMQVYQYFGEKWKIPEDTLNRFISGTGRQTDDPLKAAVLFFGYIHNYDGANHVPFIFGNSNVLDHFQGINPDDVGVVEVETQPLQWHKGTNIGHDTDMSDSYTYNRHENEWRVYDPNGIRPVRRVA